MKNRYSTRQVFNFAKDSYFERTSRPIYAIVFLLPFIIFYELGTILINTDALNQSQVRVVAFVWLQNFLEHIGFSSKFAWAMPALAVLIILIALQLASRKSWRFGFGDLWPMAIECILLAVPLIVLSLFLNGSTMSQDNFGLLDNGFIKVGLNKITCLASSVELFSNTALQGSLLSHKQALLANIVTGIGAGIYEELIFRLILICLLMALFQDFLQFDKKHAVIFAVVISASLFSAHHHILFLNGRFGQGVPFNWTEFAFRTIAGIYFAILFAIRGFGITAGTHAFYDIIATIINSVFFS